jgi:class 3 adenylate cyclase
MGVGQWLRNLGLAQYVGAFAENDIDFDVLAKLTDADLRELGVGSLGHRKRLLAAIAELQTQPERPLQSLATSATGERRQVTILFADLCGFTALSRSLDPEEIRDVVSRFTTLVDSIVVNCGGSIDKHIGDAVMALFGAPRAHDDDPVRAARAALDIHSALPRLADETGPPLQAHIGVASGEVVAGKLGRGGAHDYTVLGDSVNLAARLVAMANPGETLLSDRVCRALGGRGVCEPSVRQTSKVLKRPSQFGDCKDFLANLGPLTEVLLWVEQRSSNSLRRSSRPQSSDGADTSFTFAEKPGLERPG